MKKLKTTRVIDELGRVVLPVEVRTALGWREKTLLDVCYDTDTGEVSLKAHEDSCIYCGATKDLLTFENQSLCSACQQKIAKLSLDN